MCRIKLLLLLSVIVSFPTSSRGDVPPPLFSKGEVVFNGKQLGTPGSLRNDGNVIANLLDANSWTRWDSPDNTGTDWAGVDAGIATNPTRVRISVRGGYEDWSVGGRIQASNDATFATGTATLLTIGSRPITRNAFE